MLYSIFRNILSRTAPTPLLLSPYLILDFSQHNLHCERSICPCSLNHIDRQPNVTFRGQ